GRRRPLPPDRRASTGRGRSWPRARLPRLGELAVAMLVLPARPARARRVAADGSFDDPAFALGQRRLRYVQRRQVGQDRPGGGVDVRGVVVARERIEVLFVEVGTRRRRRGLEIDLQAYQDTCHLLV